MGSLQLPIAMTVRDSLGGSSSYCTIIAQSRLSQAMPYFSSFTSGLTSWWQVMYIHVYIILYSIIIMMSVQSCMICIRESVDSLCRDDADMPMPPYMRKAYNRPNTAFVSLFR